MAKKFTSQEKQIIVERYVKYGESPSTIIQTFCVPKSTFYYWLKEYKIQQEKLGNKSISPKTVNDLKRKNLKLELMLKIIQESRVLPSSPLHDKLDAAEKLSDKYNIHSICDALNISRGTYYNFVKRNKRDNIWYRKRREILRVKIQEIYDKSNQVFGADKIAATLKNKGITVSSKIIRELMREMGLLSIRNGSKKFYYDECKKTKNYLNQKFDVDKPNQVWVSDVTIFLHNGNYYYICVIIDLYARLVVNYKIGINNSTQLILHTFKKAFTKRGQPHNLLIHTDNGSNFRSKSFNSYLKKCKVIHSYSRAYNPYDNSVVETFFSSLKREYLYRYKMKSEREFLSIVDKYITFYNTERPHAKLKYLTPEQKEREYVKNNISSI